MHWRDIQKSNFRHLPTLAEFLDLDLTHFYLNANFPLNVPLRLAQKMNKSDPKDPLLRQFVPLAEESFFSLDFVKEPVQDGAFCQSKKLLKKYAHRALLLVSSACAMHCRFCFRQNFAYFKEPTFEEEFKLIQDDSSLKEIILSGGDPLSISDSFLKNILDNLQAISHVQVIRFHTRFPIGIPERITSSFLEILENCQKQIVFILHANHPRELDIDVLNALKNIQKLRIPILLQSVLLKGVNDEESTLIELYQRCISHGIIPYYLHKLDKVEGSMHFEVSDLRAKEIFNTLRSSLPGYAIPRYVSEIPYELSKTVII